MFRKLILSGFVALGAVGCGEHVCSEKHGTKEECYVSSDRCYEGEQHPLEKGSDGSSECRSLGFKKKENGHWVK